MLKTFTVISATLALAGCAAPPPSSPAERAARMAVAAELTAQRCGAYAGGYGDVRQLRSDANKNMTAARKLGASDALISKARQDVNNTFTTAEVFTNRQIACNELISTIAWAEGTQ